MFENIVEIIDYIYLFFSALGEFSFMNFNDLSEFVLGLRSFEFSGLNTATITLEMFDFTNMPLVGNYGSYIRSFIYNIFNFFFYVPGFETAPFAILSLIAIIRVWVIMICIDIAYKLYDMVISLLDLFIPT